MLNVTNRFEDCLNDHWRGLVIILKVRYSNTEMLTSHLNVFF